MTTVDPTPGRRCRRRSPSRPRRCGGGWIALIFAGQPRGLDGLLHARSRCCCPSRSSRSRPADKETVLGRGHRPRRARRGARQPARRRAVGPHLPAAGRPRFGRRHVWTAGGALLGGGRRWCCWPQQRTVAGVALGWVAAQVCLNAMLASLTAAVPDRVPVAQRGGVSGWVGIPQVARLGARRGAGHRRGQRHRRRLPGDGRWRCCCWRCRSRCSPPTTRCRRAHRPALRWRALLASFWISPRRAPRLRLGLDHPVPGAARQRARHALPALLPAPTGCATPTREGGLLVLILLYTAGLVGHRGGRPGGCRTAPAGARSSSSSSGVRHGGRRAAARRRADLAGGRGRRAAARRRLRRLPRRSTPR